MAVGAHRDRKGRLAVGDEGEAKRGRGERARASDRQGGMVVTGGEAKRGGVADGVGYREDALV
jgi:hypothetical protein